MIETPISHADIVDLWPKRAALARDLTEAGFPATPGQVRVWAHRGFVPDAAFASLVKAARRRKLPGVTLRALRAGRPSHP
jgi:hypothetical protein